MSKGKYIRGALGAIINASDLFKAKTEADAQKSMRETQKFMGASDEYLDSIGKGVRFQEKPSYWEDIDKSISSSQLNDLEQVLGKKLNTYDINSVLEDPNRPLSNLMRDNLKEEDQIKGSSFIVWDPDSQSRYLVNTSGADSYVRMWTGIDYD
jgi:hypothetical protein|tara:strand:- start:6519 stop:6977 length:459 start_codon:yes stop_codon:yes gene_type:complete